MVRKAGSPPPGHGWPDEILFNVIGEADFLWGFVRLAAHGLILVVRAVFHLLTCHF